MSANLYIAGIPWEMSEQELAELFRQCGTVVGAKIPLDRATQRPRGFGFVEMSSAAEAQAAVAKLNGHRIGPRTLNVSIARPQEKKPDAPRPGGSTYTGPERRSGYDRRKNWTPKPSRPPEERRSRWVDKPGGGIEKVPFEKKPWGDKKPFGDKKPWDKKKKFGDKKPWEQRDKKPFGDKQKPWEKTGGDDRQHEARRPWEKKPFDPSKKRPGGGPGKKRWGPGGPGSGQKPGQFKRRPRP